LKIPCSSASVINCACTSDAGKNKDPAIDDSGVALNLLPYRFPATSGSDNIDGKVSQIPEIITGKNRN